MIVGNGDIASVLKELDKPDIIYFASGVSNSQETRESEYKRERELLMKYTLDNRHFVYFSSLAVFYSNTRYAQHKREMEIMVRNGFVNYTIIRIGNITWGTNPHTIINYIRNRINKGQKVEIRDEYRFIIEKEEFLYWLKLIPDWPCEMNINGKRMKVSDIVLEYCMGEKRTIYANA